MASPASLMASALDISRKFQYWIATACANPARYLGLAGSRIDAVQLTTSGQDRSKHGDQGGAHGGTLHDFALTDSEYITAVKGTIGVFNKTARVFSFQIVTNKRHSLVFGSTGDASFEYEAPPGFAIIGFVGRSAAGVDALGVRLRKHA